MTIFNWVHKKLHQNVIKDDVTKNEKSKKKSEGISEIEKNTKAILDQVGLVEALDNWFDGVLTIGTFGFDTLKFEQEEEEENIERDVGNDDECENADLDYVIVDGSIIKNIDQELDPLLISSENKFYDHHGAFEVDIEHHFDSIKTVETPVVVAAVEAEIEPQKKRTTLADLFMEEQNNDKWHGKETKKPNLYEVKDYKQKGSKLSSKFRFAKKMMPKSKSEEEKDLRPIKKVHQMIKRMLNKKIHPDMDSIKAFKKDVPFKTAQKCEVLESLHLLNVQDCVA